MDGVILVDKPSGNTSHQVVQIIKKKLGAQKVGHAGTLDPLATGLLVILINKATKLSNFFLNKDKIYEAEAQLFTETDTDDITGNIIKQEKIRDFLESHVRQVLACFNNSAYWQSPPPYSAIKVKGKKLYQYARKGVAVKIPARLVKINQLELLAYIPQEAKIKLLINCSKGTYIRSLVKDIAQKLETIATVSQLRRISSGNFHIRQATSLKKISQEKIIPLTEINLSKPIKKTSNEE